MEDLVEFLLKLKINLIQNNIIALVVETTHDDSQFLGKYKDDLFHFLLLKSKLTSVKDKTPFRFYSNLKEVYFWTNENDYLYFASTLFHHKLFHMLWLHSRSKQ